MRFAIVVASLVFQFGSCPAQQRSTSSSSVKMSLNFTTASLKALRAVAQYDGEPGLQVRGSDVSDSELASALEAVGDMARSKSELAVFELLRQFLRDRVSNNLSRELIVDYVWEEWKAEHPFAGGSDFETESKPSSRRRALSRRVIREMEYRESECRAGIDAMLRSGMYLHPAQCKVVVVGVEGERELIEQGK